MVNPDASTERLSTVSSPYMVDFTFLNLKPLNKFMYHFITSASELVGFETGGWWISLFNIAYFNHFATLNHLKLLGK